MTGRKRETQTLPIKDVHKGYVLAFRKAAETEGMTEAELFEKMYFLFEEQSMGTERAEQHIRFYRRIKEPSFNDWGPDQ